MHVFGPLDRYPPAQERSYTPRVASLGEYEAMASTLGLERIVFVQASPYGSDNACMLDALREVGGRSRGVAVIDERASDDELTRMHELGVRGVRINAATFGIDDPERIARLIEMTAAQIAGRGWHIQLFATLAVIHAVAPFLSRIPTDVVIDHMGLAKAELGPSQPGFASMAELLDAGRCWVKLSGAYRISRKEPDYPDAGAIARALIAINPRRLVWGTDWPHTGAHQHAAGREPPLIEYRPLDDGRLLDLLASWTDDAQTVRQILVDNPAELYGF